MRAEMIASHETVDESDAVLVRKAHAGDHESFGHLLLRHWATAERVAGRVIGDREAVEDLLQEAALAAYLNLRSLRAAHRFAGWFCGIVLNHCRMYLRRTNRLQQSQLLDGVASSADVQATVEEQILLRQVTAAVRTLPQAQKEAAMLVYLEGLSINEAAAILGVTSSALKVRLHRARQTLRSQFARAPERAAPRRHKERRATVVELEVFDVMLRQRTSKEGQTVSNAVILLQEEGGARVLSVWCGEQEATSIAMELHGFQSPRPMTYHFTTALLEAAGVTVRSVTISRLVKDTFYATASIQRGRTVAEIDARPSDAINIALRSHAPIFAEEEVLAQVGRPVRLTKTDRPGAAALVERFQELGRLANAVLGEDLAEEAEDVRQALRELGVELLDENEGD